MKQAPPISGCYLAELHEGDPSRGYGYFEHGTGRLVYYSDGGYYYFEAGTGRPVFYVDEGVIFWV